MKTDKEKKCERCLAHNIGENHVCPPLLRALKENYDKENIQGWRERYDELYFKQVKSFPVDVLGLGEKSAHDMVLGDTKFFIQKTITESNDELKKLIANHLRERLSLNTDTELAESIEDYAELLSTKPTNKADTE